MNQNKSYEFVSAVMDDDDLSEEAIDKLLSDSEAQQKWHEYHIIRDCMQRVRKGTGKNIGAVVQERAMIASVQTTAAYSLDKNAGYSTKPAANHTFKGFAVAASVLAVAVGVWQFWPQSSGGAAVVAEKAAPNRAEIVSVGGKPAAAKNDAVANAEAQGAVVPNAARANQATAPVEKQSAVRVEKLPEAASAAAK